LSAKAFSLTVNAAAGTSDVEGKVATVSDERVGKRANFKWAGVHESISTPAFSLNPSEFFPVGKQESKRLLFRLRVKKS